jgi:glucosamine--fructose-6-phosphate aminotransferase (isomerizing)
VSGAEGSRGTTAPGALMAAEVASQPEVLERVLREAPAAVREVAAQVRRFSPRFVLLAARGTSDHAALYAKYLIETTLGLPAGLVSTSTYTTYGAEPDLSGVLCVAVSQSGGSPDLVESTSRARAGGALTLAVTNAAGSPLAEAAQLHLDMLAGPEHSVAATKTYTASLLTLLLLVEAWRDADPLDLQDLPSLAHAALDLPQVAAVAARYRFVDKLVTTSRGYAYPTAREAALKLMETCYLSAHAFSGADLLHGPLALIDADRPVVAIVPEGAGGRALAPVLARLVERGADLCVVAPPGVGAEPTVPLPAGMVERVAPIVQIMPLQQLARELAVSRGQDPDVPRGLSKVTRTL